MKTEKRSIANKRNMQIKMNKENARMNKNGEENNNKRNKRKEKKLA